VRQDISSDVPATVVVKYLLTMVIINGVKTDIMTGAELRKTELCKVHKTKK
jgi:hypothetical protein